MKSPPVLNSALSAEPRHEPLVLIVDDDLAVRESLVALIEAFGFRTRTACNGREGLEAVETEAPEAIITDLHMPEMDGFALLSKMRATRSRIPVIAISGGISAGDDSLRAAKDLGAVATFRKPLEVLDMIDTINDLTAHRA
jgi:CheY-like chemotaxis protein